MPTTATDEDMANSLLIKTRKESSSAAEGVSPRNRAIKTLQSGQQHREDENIMKLGTCL